jgi:hypothetical protein
MVTKISVAALFAGLAAAYHAPVGDPSGNAITSPLNEVVPACKAFTIKWTPTTKGPVSLLLLKGPSTNAVYYQTIAEGIDNSGSYTWTPGADLPSTGSDPHGYGIQLIVDADGQYQYSTQIGISTEDCKDKPSSSSGYPTASSSAAPSSSKTPSYSASSNSSSICSSTATYAPPKGTSYPYATGGSVNSTIILPTKSMTVPSSLKTTATGAPSGTTYAPAQSTGAASGIKAGLGLAGAVAGLVLML